MFEALQKWRDARHHLDAAIESYIDSTALLDSSLHVNSHAIGVGSLENIVSETQQDSEFLGPRYEGLKKGSAILNKIRNRSLAPTSRLSDDVLLEIFRFCVRKDPPPYYDLICTDKHYSPAALFDLTHVCTDWRAILLATPSFWSHVDIAASNPGDLTIPTYRIQLSLERACQRPLCLDLKFSRSPGGLGMSTLLVSNVLQPYMKQLQSVYLRDWYSCTELLPFFSQWFRNARVGSVQRLVVWGEDSHTHSSVFNPCRNEDENAPLSSIPVLRLNSAAFNWDNPAYQNLVHLQIGGLIMKDSPTIDKITNILVSCPELHTLQLTNMWILENNSSPTPPVALKQLRILDLIYLDGFELLLSALVVSPNDALSLRVDLHPLSGAPGSAIQSFLARANVTRLYIRLPGFGISASEVGKYLAAAPNLGILVFHLTSKFSSAFILPSSPNWHPKLHTLYLFKGGFEVTPIQQVIQAYPSLTKLRLIKCDPHPPSIELKSFVDDIVIDDTISLEDVWIRWYDIMV